jgi:hypothetical protein
MIHCNIVALHIVEAKSMTITWPLGRDVSNTLRGNGCPSENFPSTKRQRVRWRTSSAPRRRSRAAPR